MVLPQGTYRVSGVVRDAGLPVMGARVEVAGASAQGLSGTPHGEYRLYGVAGDVELRATREGYRENTKRLLITDHQVVNFDLELSASRARARGPIQPHDHGGRRVSCDAARGGPRADLRGCPDAEGSHPGREARGRRVLRRELRHPESIQRHCSAESGDVSTERGVQFLLPSGRAGTAHDADVNLPRHHR